LEGIPPKGGITSRQKIGLFNIAKMGKRAKECFLILAQFLGFIPFTLPDIRAYFWR